LKSYQIRKSHTEDDWDHNRALVGFFEEEARHGVGNIIFDVVEVDRLLVPGGVLDRFLDDNARLIEELLTLAQVHEAARDDVRALTKLAGLRVHGGDDDEHALLRQDCPVAYHNLLYVAY
jgi:hypothetical protein